MVDTLHKVFPYIITLMPGSQLNQFILDNIALATIPLESQAQGILYASILLPGQKLITKFTADNFILNRGGQSEKFSENKVPVDTVITTVFIY